MAALVRASRFFDGLDIVPLSEDRAERLLVGMTFDERMASVHLLDVDGGVASAGAAAIAVTSHLPIVGRTISRLGRLAPVRWGVELAYQAIARHRGRFARFVPDVEPVARWRND